MAKTIAIDLNDVIRDWSGQFLYVYRKFVDSSFSKTEEDIDDFNFMNVFPFKDKMDYDIFRYENYPYELYGRAPFCDKKLKVILNEWLQNNLRDFDKEDIPDVIYFSPFEIGLTIQASMAFLAAIAARAREYYFPINSLSIWDRADIVITANPNIIEAKPEGKIAIKIEMPYNKEVQGDYNFKSLVDLIQDENMTINKLIEEK